MDYRLRKLSQYLWGWFGISEYYRPIPELEEWLRRRVRYWKQWRSLAVPLKAAIQHGVSSLSYWRIARTLVARQAMSNDWLRAQGLLSIKDLWCKAQDYGPVRVEGVVVTRAHSLNRPLRTRMVDGVGVGS